MPIFTIEVAEVVVYRGQVEAATEAEARAAAVDDLIANAGRRSARLRRGRGPHRDRLDE